MGRGPPLSWGRSRSRGWRSDGRRGDRRTDTTPIERVTLDAPALHPAAADRPLARGPRWLRAWRAGQLLQQEFTAPAAWSSLDRGVLVAWAALSALLLGRILIAERRTRRQVGRWPVHMLGPVTVRVSREIGPALAGIWSPEVVLPRWALEDARLPLMLAHEQEHQRARDPLLLLAGALGAALMPWNPAVWWQLHRLRAAVEVDCDRRVLARMRGQTQARERVLAPGSVDVRAYGTLLLDVAARAPATASVLTLGGTPSLLRRRITVMLMPRSPRPVWRAALPAATALGVAALACETPRPTAPLPVGRIPLTSITAADPRYAPDADGHAPVEAVRALLADRFPEVLRVAVGRRQQIWAVQEADGKVTRAALTSGRRAQTFTFGRAVLSVDDSSKIMRVQGTPVDGTGVGITLTDTLESGSDPALLSGIAPARISTVEVLRIPPGRVAPDSLTVVWIRLRRDGVPAAPGGATTLSATTRGAGRITLDVGTNGVPNGISSAGLDAPLVVVDGREVAGMKDLPSSDRIQEVHVLKGEAAVQAYGPRATAGGAVVVTTRSAVIPR